MADDPIVFIDSGVGGLPYLKMARIYMPGENFVYVADHDLHKIQKFTLDGTFVDQWGSFGTHDGEFKSPNGIAVDDNFVYVVDSQNYKIQKFTLDGEFVLSFA